MRLAYARGDLNVNYWRTVHASLAFFRSACPTNAEPPFYTLQTTGRSLEHVDTNEQIAYGKPCAELYITAEVNPRLQLSQGL